MSTCANAGSDPAMSPTYPSVAAGAQPSHLPAAASPAPRWTLADARAIYDSSFPDLLFKAQTIHRAHHDPRAIQRSQLLNIKSGGCPEDCGYCSQSAHHATGLAATPLLSTEEVLSSARAALAGGAARFCMGAAWRSLKPRDVHKLAPMIKGVKSLGLETCMTLGMLSPEAAHALKEAGLDYYNHNIDTSERYYTEITRTRTYQDRLDTLENVRAAGMKVCCGGILGMGESANDRIEMLVTLANLTPPPESVPINRLIPIPGTPLADAPPLDGLEFVRIIALARILMPESVVRLSAGRAGMSDELQALCFLAGANSLFVGEQLLTTANPSEDADAALFARLGLYPQPSAP